MKPFLFFLLPLLPILAAGQRTHHFSPTAYYRDFKGTTPPVLTIRAGDTVLTTSVDAGGWDEKGVRVAERGNPLTGPFFIEGAMPGDVLAITITEVKLTRDFATTLNTLVPKVLTKKETRNTWRSAKIVRWRLDTLDLTGTPDIKYPALANVRVPLHPFVGGIGLAPAGSSTLSTGGSGPSGGNLDCRYVTTGSTIYLPVSHAGALLMLGDGHAAQGDGELNGDALETTLRIGFTTQLLKQKADSIPTPMIETEEGYYIFGIERTLQSAMQSATRKWVTWLGKKHGLSFEEASQVIGPSIRFEIPKVAATQVEVTGMLPKKVLVSIDKP